MQPEFTLPVTIITAVAANGIIGNKGDLPWPRVRADFRYFKEQTLGHPVIMGETTWISLPEAHRPLTGRTNIVLSFKPRPDSLPSEVLWANNPVQALTMAALSEGSDAIFIIGGASIYKLFADAASRLLITRFDQTFEGDTSFPDMPGDWQLTQSTPFTDEPTGITGAFQELTRRSNRSPVVYPTAARSVEQSAEYRAINTMGACPFCYPDGYTWKNPAQPLLREGTHWGLFANFNPYQHSEHHLLAVSKHHVSHSAELPAGAMEELVTLTKAQCEVMGVTGWATMIREYNAELNGTPTSTGQSVAHLHAHILVPKKGEVIRPWIGEPATA
jgi:dihydrofolate reductase